MDGQKAIGIENLLEALNQNNIKLKEWVIEQLNNAEINNNFGIKIDFVSYDTISNDYYCPKKTPPSLQLTPGLKFQYADYDTTTNNYYIQKVTSPNLLLNIETKTDIIFADEIVQIQEEE